MQDNSKKLYLAVSNVLSKVKDDKGIKYTDLCYGSNLAMSTYDDIINAKNKASFYNISKLIKGLDLTFEDFGKLLDEELGKDFDLFDC